MADDLAASWSALPNDVYDNIDWTIKAYATKTRNNGPDWPCIMCMVPVLKPIVEKAPSALPKLISLKTAQSLACYSQLPKDVWVVFATRMLLRQMCSSIIHQGLGDFEWEASETTMY